MGLSRMGTLVLAASLASFAASHLDPTVLKIGAFQIDIFGTAKGNKPDVMDAITEITFDYDVILIQDIRQASMQILDDLLGLLNDVSTEQFAYMASERLGRSSSKSQYAYYYKVDKVDVLGTHQFKDVDDKFEREPFSIHIAPKVRPSGWRWRLTKLRLSRRGMRIKPFVQMGRLTKHRLSSRIKPFVQMESLALIGIQGKPTDAPAEIVALKDVYDDVRTQFGTDNVIVLGNMVADCAFVNDADLAASDLFNDTDTFLSPIDNDADTTSSSSDCAYDRILVSDSNLHSLVFVSGVQIPENDFGITNDLMQDVSNHYPVFVDLLVPCQWNPPSFWEKKGGKKG